MNNKFKVPAMLLLTFLTLSVGAVTASAHFLGNDADMTKTLAQKLGVSEEKVKAAFEDLREEHEAKMKADLETKLTQAVTNGKITDAQKQAILKKFSEEKPKIDPQAFKDMTDEQRKAEMATKKSELESWARENNIDLSTLHELIGRGKGGKGIMRRPM